MGIVFSEGVTKRRMSLQRFAEVTATNAARILGLYPQKGVIAPGSDADLIIIDPAIRKTLAREDFHVSDYSPWEGWPIQGWPVTTILRGRVVVENGRLAGDARDGKLVRRRIAPEVLRRPACMETYGKLPLSFEANDGQADPQVKFLSRGRGYTLFLTSTETVLVLREGASARNVGGGLPAAKRERGKALSGTVLRMTFVKANPAPAVAGVGELPGKSSYFVGNDPKKWRANVLTYAKVEYRDVYPGVNLVYYGNQRQLEHDFVVSPGADPKAITLAFEGMDGVAIDGLGDLVLRADGGEVRLRKPVVYQEQNGQRAVIPTRYVLKAERQVAFEVAAYDATKPLIIDPVLAYSTYLGGSGGDQGLAIAVDAVGNAYVTGFAGSSDFPTTAGAFQTAFGGGEAAAFVTTIDPSGSALVYTTYLGGDGFDQGHGIAVDATGNAYVTGHTFSTNFPTTTGTLQPGTSELSSP